MRTIEGSLLGEGLRVALVVSRFNGFLTEQLLSGALDTLRRHGVREDDLTVIRVPGTFEIAAAARRALASASGKGAFDALWWRSARWYGARRRTSEYVAGEAVKGLGQIALEGQVAVGFGILTTENLEQAIARAGTKMGNKGADACASGDRASQPVSRAGQEALTMGLRRQARERAVQALYQLDSNDTLASGHTDEALRVALAIARARPSPRSRSWPRP